MGKGAVRRDGSVGIPDRGRTGGREGGRGPLSIVVDN